VHTDSVCANDTYLNRPTQADIQRRDTSVQHEDPDATVIRPPPPWPGRPPPAAWVAAKALDPDATVVRAPSTLPQAPAGTPALPATAAPALPAGFVLHEYRIERVLGQGGFGITYLATDTHLNAAVAIKEYLPQEVAFRTGDYSVSPAGVAHRESYRQGLEAFLAEARTLAALRHPAIVRVARFFEAHRTAYMVLEYERGLPLKAWWPQHREVGEAGLVERLLPLFDGLEAVHAAGFLHRDIKPDNIQVREADGSFVLLDFGSAGQAAAVAIEGAVVLTPGYAPPEQYDATGGGAGHGVQGPWTDVYALAATLYWAVAGRKPPDAELRVLDPARHRSAAEAAAGQAEGVARVRFGAAFLAAIDRALSLRPGERPQSVAEFRRELCADHLATLRLDEALLRGTADAAPQRPGWFARLAASRWRVRDWPLAPKIAAAMVATALLPLLMAGGINAHRVGLALADAELENLELLASGVASRLGQFVEDGRHVARGLATDEQLIGLLAAPPALPAAREAQLAAVAQRLQRIAEADPDLQLIMLIDPAGTVLVSNDPEVIGRNLAFRDYFQLAIAGGASTTGVIIGAVAGASGIVSAEPVHAADGRIVGVLALRLLGSTIDRIVGSVRGSAAGTSLVPFVVDADGVVVSHPDAAWRFRSLQPIPPERQAVLKADQRFRRDRVESLGETTLATAVVQARSSGRPGHVAHRSVTSGRDEMVGLAPVPGFDGTVALAKDRAAFEAPLNAMRLRLLAIAGVVGLLFSALALGLARSIVGPVRKLSVAAEALKGGSSDSFDTAAAAVAGVPRRDELGQLARTFGVLIEVLRRREQGRAVPRGQDPP
jgi:serine/threonine protein kinase/HAMP domain-containing protein